MEKKKYYSVTLFNAFEVLPPPPSLVLVLNKTKQTKSFQSVLTDCFMNLCLFWLLSSSFYSVCLVLVWLQKLEKQLQLKLTGAHKAELSVSCMTHTNTFQNYSSIFCIIITSTVLSISNMLYTLYCYLITFLPFFIFSSKHRTSFYRSSVKAVKLIQ